MTRTRKIAKVDNQIARTRLTPVPENIWALRIIIAVSARQPEDLFKPLLLDPLELVREGKEISADQYQRLKTAVHSLLHVAFQDIPCDDGSIVGLPVFAEIKLSPNGEILAQLNPNLKKYYENLKSHFALISVPDFCALSSIYAQMLYKLLVSWKNLDSQYYEIPLEELHTRLNTPVSFRKNFHNFKVFVLDIAQAEINALYNPEDPLSLYFEWVPIRSGNRPKSPVKAIAFTFSRRVIPEKKALPPARTTRKQPGIGQPSQRELDERRRELEKQREIDEKQRREIEEEKLRWERMTPAEKEAVLAERAIEAPIDVKAVDLVGKLKVPWDEAREIAKFILQRERDKEEAQERAEEETGKAANVREGSQKDEVETPVANLLA